MVISREDMVLGGRPAGVDGDDILLGVVVYCIYCAEGSRLESRACSVMSVPRFRVEISGARDCDRCCYLGLF